MENWDKKDCDHTPIVARTRLIDEPLMDLKRKKGLQAVFIKIPSRVYRTNFVLHNV